VLAALRRVLHASEATSAMTSRALSLVTGGGGVEAAARLVLDIARRGKPGAVPSAIQVSSSKPRRDHAEES
jgi:hypothetical protein